ncbi:MAG: DUF2442 domain-containing protein [Bacteroidetes bacterium]|nr:DUF2442 domain-containing protein [Bacteroidota bacterium]
MRWIIKILEVEPFKVTCLWNDDIIRTIDLEPFLRLRAKNQNDSYTQLINVKRFSEVKCDGTTLYWENGISMKDTDGTVRPAPIDIDPDVLYEMTLTGRKRITKSTLA